MKKKLMIIIIIIFLLTGCTAEVNLNVNEQLEVEENVKINFSNSFAKNFLSISDYINKNIIYYEDKIFEDDYSYNINEGNVISNVEFNRKSDKICNAFNSVFSKELYDDIKCLEDKNYITIRSVGNLKIAQPINFKKFNVKNLELKISLPILATDSNADLIDGNTYIWKYDSNMNINEEIYLKISKEDLKKKIGKQKILHILKILKIPSVVLLLFLIIGVILYVKCQNRKLEY